MNWLDFAIALLVIFAVFRGIRHGFIRQLCTALGFFGGLFIGAMLANQFVNDGQSATTQTAISLSLTFGGAFVLMIICEHLGNSLKSRLVGEHFHAADRVLGAVLAVTTTLLGVWLAAAILLNASLAGWQAPIQNSKIITILTNILPPAPKVIDQLSSIVNPNGIPQAFAQNEPNPQEKPVVIPDLGELTAGVRTAAPSVVKIEGNGCGGIVDGSGFIGRQNYVITNAHVVAGVGRPTVIDSRGTHPAAVVWFNPDLDLAILYAPGLAGTALTISTVNAPSGTATAILGYPGGGDFAAKPGAVVDTFQARGKNIYGQDTARREIYSLKADVIDGNSGGPVIDSSGAVIGVVFAHSSTYSDTGYALTMQQVQNELDQAIARNTQVGTGSCAQP